MVQILNSLTITFDNGIQSVNFSYGSNEHTFSTSGEQYAFTAEPGSDITLTVNLKSGYTLKSSSLGSVSGNIVTIPFSTVTKPTEMTCTLVSEAAIAKKSVDLTTLSGWKNLAPGNHTIKIVAKGTGYRDSEKSAGVVVNKATGETWLLNDTDNLTLSNQDFTSLNFTSNSQSFVRILRQYDNRPIPPVNSLLYYKSDGTYVTVVYTNDDGIAFWNNQAYRTLTFETAPTGDLLTWLQANGTKQGAGYNVTVTYSYQCSGDWSGLAYYSTDDGATWIDLYDSTNPATKTIENITQIKFKSYKDSVGNYSYISGSGDLSGISFGNPWQYTDEVSANVVLTQNSSVNISYGD